MTERPTFKRKDGLVVFDRDTLREAQAFARSHGDGICTPVDAEITHAAQKEMSRRAYEYMNGHPGADFDAAIKALAAVDDSLLFIAQCIPSSPRDALITVEGSK